MRNRTQSNIDFGRQIRVWRPVGRRISLRWDQHVMVVSGALVTVALGLVALSLASGTYPIAFSDLFGGLEGSTNPTAHMILFEWRLPRAALALLLGAALGMSGAIFQSLTRNPLGSPDIIGFSAGSYTGALVVILLLSGGYYAIALGALVGGILTAMAVYLLAYRRGLQGFRLIIVGIGVAAMLSALNAWMIREADLKVAMSAAVWGAGSLNGLGVEQLVPVAVMLGIIVPPLLVLSRSMRQLEMGDDAARASGVNANRTRLLLMVLGVALTAIVTAAAGPIAFIALAAPQIARRITRSAGVALVPSALMGGVLLMAADWVAQHAFSVQLPVGVMTVSIGGLYFAWLLLRESRK